MWGRGCSRRAELYLCPPESPFLPLPGGCFSRPGLGPAADLLSFVSPPVRRPKESRQSKGDPDVRDPFASLRGNLRRGGCGVRCGTRCVHCVNSAQTTAASQITKQSCPSAGLQPRNHHAAGADIRGVGSGLRFARPRFEAERSDGAGCWLLAVGCWLPQPPPFCQRRSPAAKRRVVGSGGALLCLLSCRATRK